MPEQRLYAAHHGGSGVRRRLRGVPATAWAAGFFLALTLAVFGKVLVGPGDVVLSNIDADLAKQFVHWRAFGFGELRAGRLALWNPHIFAGAPYLGGFQSALLYPPNWLYLCLPLARAVNVGIALHVFLAGWFMFLWMRQRGLHPLACVTAGVWFMFCGPFFPHIHAGHLPNLCTMVWAPLLFLAIDGWLGRRTAGWLLLGAGVIAMLILAGHPQYVFYLAVAAGLYCALCLWKAERRVEAAAGLGAMGIGAVGLSAAQLFEGLHAARESIRSVGIDMDFASMFSFPPENFLTLVVPGFFGDMTHQEYWGRCYLWEMSLFFGVTGVLFAAYGAFRGERAKRRFCAGLAVVLLLPALGGHTPLFQWLYLYAPGFDKFRGWSKFTFPATLFLIVLAAVGFDRMLRAKASGRGMATAAATLGISLVGMAVLTQYLSPWTGWMNAIHATGEQLTLSEHIEDASFIRAAGHFASRQLLIAACVAFALGAAFTARRRYPRALWAVPLVAIVEMLMFAASTFDTFHLGDVTDTPTARFLRHAPTGDYRVLVQGNADLAMSSGARDVWGYDPGVLRRYAEWMCAAQGQDPDDASQALEVSSMPTRAAILVRCRYVIRAHTDDSIAVEPMPFADGSTRVRLVSDARVLHDGSSILAAMNSPAFNPDRTIILETAPDPPPVPDAPAGRARIVAETSDALTIEADLPQAAVLMVADAYCTGWQARSLLPPDKSRQARYEVLPADYCFRGIPLAAGYHRILLEYCPRAFVIGKWTTVVSLSLYLVLVAMWTWRRQAGFLSTSAGRLTSWVIVR